MTGETKFLDLDLHMWNSPNIQSSKFHIMPDNQNKKTFPDPSDSMVSMFKQMDTYSL